MFIFFLQFYSLFFHFYILQIFIFSSFSFFISQLMESEPVRKKVKRHKKKAQKAALGNMYVPKPNNNKRMSVDHIRPILVSLLDGSNLPPPWISSWHKPADPQVIVCIVPGLESGIKYKVNSDNTAVPIHAIDLGLFLPLSSLQGLRWLFQLRSPAQRDLLFSFTDALLSVPLTRREKKDRLEQLQKAKLTPADCLLSLDQMKFREYPLPNCEGYFTTKDLGTPTKIFGLDCEFCNVGSEKVLTRICLIEEDGSVILDQLVKPSQEITDYKTEYSGITREMLERVTTTLDEVQATLLTTISSLDILVGHSLDSDLRVLKISHSRIIDTAILYEHAQGPPRRPLLRWLAQKYLNREIQNSSLGHHPEEDARASVDLMKLKLKNGPLFGTVSDEVPLVERLKVSASYIDKLASTAPPGFEFCPVTSDEEATKSCLEQAKDKKLVLLTLRDAEPENKTSVANSLQLLVEHAPTNSAIIIVSPTTNEQNANSWSSKKKQALKNHIEWTPEDQQQLQEAVKAAREGYFLFGFKP